MGRTTAPLAGGAGRGLGGCWRRGFTDAGYRGNGIFGLCRKRKQRPLVELWKQAWGRSGTLPPPPLHGDFVMPHRAQEEAERGPFESVGGNFPGSAIILSNPRARTSVFVNSVPETLHLPRDDSRRVA